MADEDDAAHAAVGLPVAVHLYSLVRRLRTLFLAGAESASGQECEGGW